ncbi:MAG: hypothetical protein NTU77_06790 [Actinobacteria bacterium]|nr:hypothetical protein [Actinomycetota bacterium]
MTVLFVLLAMAAIGAVGLAAAGRLGELPEAEPDRRPEYVNSGSAPRRTIMGPTQGKGRQWPR